MESREALLTKFNKIKSENLHLDMSRGKPCKEQLDLSIKMLDVINSSSSFISNEDIDVRNYGNLTGLQECKDLMADILELPSQNIIIGGNSSLNLMYDQIMRSYCFGVCGNKPWKDYKRIKWLCVVPGYDRHFAITERFGFEMINIPLKTGGPDIDLIEKYIQDEEVKGIWCVPKFSNPSGVTYSDEVVRRLASLKPKARDFRIYWDNAYALHYLQEDVPLLNIYEEALKIGNEDIVYIFGSTNKITFPGSGVAALGASDKNIKDISNHLKYQTISYDKINQLRHVRYLKNKDNILNHLEKHRQILKPKFDMIVNGFEAELKGIASWSKPLGGYFIVLEVPNKAQEVIKLCEECGLKLTSSGCTHPYHHDPSNTYIRIAPSFPSLDEIKKAIEIIVLAVKLAQ